MRSAFLVIANHGADLTNVIFMRPFESAIFEIAVKTPCHTMKTRMWQEVEPWKFENQVKNHSSRGGLTECMIKICSMKIGPGDLGGFLSVTRLRFTSCHMGVFMVRGIFMVR